MKQNLFVPKPPKSRLVKLATMITISLIVVVLFLISLFTFWKLQDPEILTIKGSNKFFAVRPDTNAPGQVEYMMVDYCKNENVKGTIVARMVGEKSIIRIPWPNEDQSPQCLSTEVPIVIPTYATDDTYYFDFTITYKVNPIKNKEVYLRSQSFTVDAKL